MGIAERLTSLMGARGLTTGQLAVKAGLTYDAIYKILNGVRKNPAHDTLVKLARALDVPVSEITGEVSAPAPGLRRVPIIGDLSCGRPVIVTEEDAEYLNLPDSAFTSGQEIIAMRVHGDSMDRAGLRDGSTAIIRLQDIADDREIVAACIGEESTIKRLRVLDGGFLALVPESDNPTHLPITGRTEEIRIVGVVIGSLWG